MNLIKNLFGKIKTVLWLWRKPAYPRLAKNVANSIPLSPDTIRLSLGLHEWDAYRRTILEKFATLEWVDGERDTGRTTKLMVEALSYASEGRSVCFVVKTKADETQARHKLISYAKQLGIEQKIRVTNLSRVNKITKRTPFNKINWIVVYDHYALGID